MEWTEWPLSANSSILNLPNLWLGANTLFKLLGKILTWDPVSILNLTYLWLGPNLMLINAWSYSTFYQHFESKSWTLLPFTITWLLSEFVSRLLIALSIWLRSFSDHDRQTMAKLFHWLQLLHLRPIAGHFSGFPCRLQHLICSWRWTWRRIPWRIGVSLWRILVCLRLGFEQITPALAPSRKYYGVVAPTLSTKNELKIIGTGLHYCW